MARKPGRPGREIRPRSLTVDFHSHVGVLRAAELVKPHLDPQASPLVRFTNSETKALNEKQEADVAARRGLERRLADLDAMGVDMQVVKPPPPQCYYAVPLDIAVKAAQVVNDGIAEFVAQKPDRLVGFGSVPKSEAAKELERCVTKLSFKGVQILTNVNGKELSDPLFGPFWNSYTTGCWGSRVSSDAPGRPQPLRCNSKRLGDLDRFVIDLMILRAI